MKRRCVIVGAPAEVPPELYEITADIAGADIAIIDGVWFSRLRPLGGIADDEAIAQHLRERGVLDFADLERLNLDELAAAPGVGRQALHRFVRDLSRSNRYPDANRLQEFIIRRGIFV
ncbi:MAG TPA: helix-hairpin-helix domain-containing protein [Thermoanaerobaculia bacterium]|jgi:hypothetical protein|nr:helix-hairpin-helix domain-containing protein [Thermoanaerobaculia bacterium]